MIRIEPCSNLPDTWGGQGACPVCRVRGHLTVAHQASAPDQMQCGACGSAFEVEADGDHLRLVRLPAALAGAAPALLDTWLLSDQIPERIEAALPTHQGDQATGEPAPPPSASEAEPPLPASLLDELLAAVTASAAPAPDPGVDSALSAADLDELAAAVADFKASHDGTASAPVGEAAGTAAPSSTEDLAERARQLHALGNPIPLIRSTLERTGAAPEAVAAALAQIVSFEQARRRRHARTFRWAAAAAGLLLLALVVGVMLVSLASPPAAQPAAVLTSGAPVPTPTLRYNPIIAIINLFIPNDVDIANGPRPTPGPTSAIFGMLFSPTQTPPPATVTARAATQAALAATAAAGTGGDGRPDWVRQLSPDNLAAMLGPTPSVEHEGPSASGCPFLTLDAAAVFGGKPDDWHFDRDSSGWILIVVDQPITLRVPANMSAGYLVSADTLEVRLQLGPATIHNVNFAAVNCGP